MPKHIFMNELIVIGDQHFQVFGVISEIFDIAAFILIWKNRTNLHLKIYSRLTPNCPQLLLYLVYIPFC